MCPTQVLGIAERELLSVNEFSKSLPLGRALTGDRLVEAAVCVGGASDKDLISSMAGTEC